MRVEELQIGDWVLQNHSNVFLKVNDITPPYISAYKQGGQFHANCLSPVPLITHFVRKNGWKQVRLNDGVDYDLFDLYEFGDDVYCGIRFYESGFIRIYIENDINHANIHKTISYVHELQHALRMCGIKKEIVL